MAPFHIAVLLRSALSVLFIIVLALPVSSQTDTAQRVFRLRGDATLLTAPVAGSGAAGALLAGQPVILLDSAAGYARVEADGVTGYVARRNLAPEPGMRPSDLRGWVKVSLRSGAQVNCPPVTAVTDPKLDNFLRIIVGGADVVVRIISRGNGRCIRSVYIRSGEMFEARNIPPDRYYLKYASGTDWRQKTTDSICAGKFMRDATYYMGDQELDFHPEPTTIPSYEVRLQVSRPDVRTTYPTTTISEKEFNR